LQVYKIKISELYINDIQFGNYMVVMTK